MKDLKTVVVKMPFIQAKIPVSSLFADEGDGKVKNIQ